MPKILSKLRVTAPGSEFASPVGIGSLAPQAAAGSGNALNLPVILSAANSVSGISGNTADGQAYSLLQAPVMGMGPAEGWGAMVGPFGNNLLTGWTDRGGTVTTYTTDGTAVSGSHWYRPDNALFSKARRSSTNIQSPLGQATRNFSIAFIDPAASGSDALILHSTIFQAFTPYLVARALVLPIVNLKVELLLSSDTWTTIYNGTPTFIKGVWRGPGYRVSSGALWCKQVMFTFTLTSYDTSLNNGNQYEFYEIGLASNLAIQGSTLWASPYRDAAFHHAFALTSPGADLSSGSGYLPVMRSTSGGGLRPITLAGFKTFLSLGISDVASLQAGLDAKAPTSRTVSTQHSLTGGGDLSANRTLSLVGDTGSPGNSRYYGTDGSGARGWHPLPAGEGGPHTHPAGDIVSGQFNASRLAPSPVTGSVLCTSSVDAGVWVAATGDAQVLLSDFEGVPTFGKVLNQHIRNASSCSVLGRSSNSTGSVADIAAAANGHFLRRSGNALGFGAITLADLPAGVGSGPAVIAWKHVTVNSTTGAITGTVSSGGSAIIVEAHSDSHEFIVRIPASLGNYVLRISVRPPVATIDDAGHGPAFERIADESVGGVNHHTYHVWSAGNPYDSLSATPITNLCIEAIQ